MSRLINVARVKQLTKDLALRRGRRLRVSKEYLDALDYRVQALIASHVGLNGSHGTMRADVVWTNGKQ